jgi:hypothetical protein
MKIVSNKSNGGFIVDLTRQEMANILGFNDIREIDKNNGNPLQDGSDIDISRVHGAYRQLDVKTLRDQVAKLQGIITILISEVSALPVPEIETALPAKRKITVTTQDGTDLTGSTRGSLMQEIFRISQEQGAAMNQPASFDPLPQSPWIPADDHHRASGNVYFDGAAGNIYRQMRDDRSNLDQ